jgi:hypothetical protein
MKMLAARAVRPGLLDLTARAEDLQHRLARLEAMESENRGKIDRLVAEAEKRRDHSEELGFSICSSSRTRFARVDEVWWRSRRAARRPS